MTSTRGAGCAEEQPLHVPRIGTDSVASTSRQDSLAGAVRFYRIAFRTAIATASITVQGLDDRVSVRETTQLVRPQHRGIESAGPLSRKRVRNPHAIHPRATAAPGATGAAGSAGMRACPQGAAPSAGGVAR